MRRCRIVTWSSVVLTFVLVALVGICSTAQAAVALSDSVMLSDLITSGGSVMAGDKLFDQFAYSASGDMPSSSNVQVIPIEAAGNYGIRLFSGFFDYAGDGASIATLSYRVTALDAGMGINGAQLSGNPAVVGNGGTGFFTIEKSFSSLEMPTQLVIFDQVPGGTKLADSVGLNSVYPTLTVEVTLTGDSTSSEGAVNASFVDQTFSQGVVPEPQSLLIWMGSALLFGAVTLIHRRWVPHYSRQR